MPTIKESIINPAIFFSLDGLDRQKGKFVIYYNNKIKLPSGELDETKLQVGLRYFNSETEVLIQPYLIRDWFDGSGVAYTSLSNLLGDFVTIAGISVTSSSGISISQLSDNFSSLDVGSTIGDIAYIKESEGTAWLPSTLGGTYKPKGWYVWNGTDWVSDRDAIAKQLNDNILNFDSKVDKDFLGWIQITDTIYTPLYKLSISANTRTLLPNNSGNILNIVGVQGGGVWWDSINNKFTPDNSGDTYDWRVQFTVNPNLNNRNISLELDIGGTQGVIWDKTLLLARGAGVDTRITETLDIYTLNTFITNGGELYVTCDGDIDICDILFKIERKFRNQ